MSTDSHAKGASRAAHAALLDIFAKGNRARYVPGQPLGEETPNWFRCVDGTTLSVIAGWGTYCTPRPDYPSRWGGVPLDYPGPYSEVEAWFQNEDDPRSATRAEVYEYIEAHGGLAEVAPGNCPEDWHAEGAGSEVRS